jgi:site-specific DNA recombinase
MDTQEKKAKGHRLYEAKIVKEIFSMYVDKNISMCKIARTLNARKVPTKMSSLWNSSTIRQILLNPTHIGKVRYALNDENRYFEADGHHEPIISNEMFCLAGEKIKNLPSKSRTKAPREENYYTSVLYCSRCKGKFTTHNYKANKHDKSYSTSYRCRTKTDCSVNVCESPNISHKKIELAFCEYIKNISDIAQNNDINIEDITQNAEQDLLKSIVDNEKKLNTLQNRKNQIMGQYVQGSIEFDEYKRMIKMFNENYEVLENEIQQKKSEMSIKAVATEIFPEDIILNIKQNWEHLSNVEKAIFLQRFVEKITITTEKIHRNVSRVRIDSIEFQMSKLPIREMTRQKLR